MKKMEKEVFNTLKIFENIIKISLSFVISEFFRCFLT